MSTVVIPAGGSARIQMRGWCMDEGLPAPTLGDKLRLRPASLYFDTRLQGLEQAVLRYAAQMRLPETTVQHILWGLRGVSSADRYALSLVRRPDLLAILERARAGSAALVQRLVNEEVSRRKAQQDIARLIDRALGGNGRQPLLGDLLNDLLDPRASERAIERQLQVQTLPLEQRRAVPDAAQYSKLADGVYARTVGTAPLVVQSIIINESARPFVFDPTQWVAESLLPQQRVAFGGVARAEVTQPKASSAAAMDWTKFFGELAEAIRDKLMGIGSAHQRGAAERLVQHYTQRLAQLHPVLREATAHLPVLGNIISLTRAMDASRHPIDRFIDFLGAVPGYGNLVTLAGSSARLAATAKRVADAHPGFFRSIDRISEWVQDLRTVAEVTPMLESNRSLWEATREAAADVWRRITA